MCESATASNTPIKSPSFPPAVVRSAGQRLQEAGESGLALAASLLAEVMWAGEGVWRLVPSGGHTCPRPALCSWVQEQPVVARYVLLLLSPLPPTKPLNMLPDSERGTSVRRRTKGHRALSFFTCKTRMVNPLPGWWQGTHRGCYGWQC